MNDRKKKCRYEYVRPFSKHDSDVGNRPHSVGLSIDEIKLPKVALPHESVNYVRGSVY